MKIWSRKIITSKNYDKICAFIIGTGIALSAIHNYRLTQLLTNEEGVTNLFLPSAGMAFWFIGVLAYAANNYKSISLGSKKVYVPLLLIVAAISLSGISHGGIIPFFMGLGLFGVYLVARILRNDIYAPLMIGAVIASLGVFAYAVTNPGIESGGYVFEGNYDIVVGYVLCGAVLYKFKKQHYILGLALAAMFLTGSPEAVFALAVLGLAAIIIDHFSLRKAIIAVLPLLLTVAAVWGSGYLDDLYHYTFQVATNQVTVTGEGHTVVPGSDGTAIGYRWHVISTAMQNIKPLGDGYNITGFKATTIHNIPLIMVQQLGYPGILAALAFIA